MLVADRGLHRKGHSLVLSVPAGMMGHLLHMLTDLLSPAEPQPEESVDDPRYRRTGADRGRGGGR